MVNFRDEGGVNGDSPNARWLRARIVLSGVSGNRKLLSACAAGSKPPVGYAEALKRSAFPAPRRTSPVVARLKPERTLIRFTRRVPHREASGSVAE
jgi:hypothetical protein